VDDPAGFFRLQYPGAEGGAADPTGVRINPAGNGGKNPTSNEVGDPAGFCRRRYPGAVGGKADPTGVRKIPADDGVALVSSTFCDL
jgi:hypothetical protein